MLEIEEVELSSRAGEMSCLHTQVEMWTWKVKQMRKM